MTKVLANVRRISELGMLGEQLAAEALASYGFENVRNLNLDIRNHPFADLIAEKGAPVTLSV